jgi:indole-3-acetate monooxygenase
MTITTTVVDTVRALAPLIRDHVASIDADRRLPEPIVRALIDAGVFKLWVPRAFGGADADPLTLFQVVEELARADGSTGWVTTLIGSYGMLGGLLPEEAGQEIYAAPDAAVAGTLALLGDARVVDGGYRVSGRWPYASGIWHSTWVLGGCRLLDGETPRLRPDGQPDGVILFFPRAKVEIVDTWHTTGLRGTGSNDYEVHDVFVPARRACSRTDEPAQPGPLHTLPYVPVTICIMAGVALGIARRALDELEDLAAVKPFARSETTLGQNAPSQVQIGEAEGLLHAGRAFVCQALSDAWETVQRGERISWKQHGLLRLAGLQAVTQALQVVDLAFRTGGATSVKTTNPIERCLRDIRTAAQHNCLTPNNYQQAGQLFLGSGPSDSAWCGDYRGGS